MAILGFVDLSCWMWGLIIYLSYTDEMDTTPTKKMKIFFLCWICSIILGFLCVHIIANICFIVWRIMTTKKYKKELELNPH